MAATSMAVEMALTRADHGCPMCGVFFSQVVKGKLNEMADVEHILFWLSYTIYLLCILYVVYNTIGKVH